MPPCPVDCIVGPVPLDEMRVRKGIRDVANGKDPKGFFVMPDEIAPSFTVT